MAGSRSLNAYPWLRSALVRHRRGWLKRIGGHRLARSAEISGTARLIASRRGSISVGDLSTIGPLATLCAVRPEGSDAPIVIGARCFVGGNALIGPGVTIGDGVVIAAGAVVLRDLPDDCIAAGNPARVIRNGISAGPFGRLSNAAARRRERIEEACAALAAAVTDAAPQQRSDS